MRQDSKLSPAE